MAAFLYMRAVLFDNWLFRWERNHHMFKSTHTHTHLGHMWLYYIVQKAQYKHGKENYKSNYSTKHKNKQLINTSNVPIHAIVC